MKRQRSKAELLYALRVHEALKEDTEKGYNLQEKTVFWRMGVIWTTVLWKEDFLHRFFPVKFFVGIKSLALFP